MPDAVYRRDGDLYVPTQWAGGPWSTQTQHGGPVNALLASAMVEAAEETGFEPARITIDLLGPVPMKPLRLERTYARRGRRHAVVLATLLDDDRAVARATGVLFRPNEGLEASWEHEDAPLPPPDGLESTPLMHKAYQKHAPPGFHWSLEVRIVPGPLAAAWIRTPLELIEGERMQPILHAAAVSDLTYGLAARTMLKRGFTPADRKRVMLINTDTNLFFERAPVGEWFGFRHEIVADRRGIGLAEVTQFDRHEIVADRRGIGLAEVTQFDERGRYGRALQVTIAQAPEARPSG
ncbi:MAG: thioesterase family protein [Deltaproteobacteria bacterium]|nr:thioesterase family protein [Deltaproteobacteria bacterium]